MNNVVLLGSHPNSGRTMREGKIVYLRSWAKRQGLEHWAIYRLSFRGRPFHNSTDEDYLIEHHNSPFWLNRGVASA